MSLFKGEVDLRPTTSELDAQFSAFIRRDPSVGLPPMIHEVEPGVFEVDNKVWDNAKHEPLEKPKAAIGNLARNITVWVRGLI